MIEKIDYIPEGYVKWYSDLMGVTYVVPARCCLLCAKCTDVFLDYTNGPYMFICDDNHDTAKGMDEKCNYFEEEYDNGT